MYYFGTFNNNSNFCNSTKCSIHPPRLLLNNCISERLTLLLHLISAKLIIFNFKMTKRLFLPFYYFFKRPSALL
uniref:Uncharacterized protein n=1 Tax=viral metagenome TaxID=1070528 RepID=A0A6C0LIB4_9ZZZZ